MDKSQGSGHVASDIAGHAIYFPAYAITKFCCLVAEVGYVCVNKLPMVVTRSRTLNRMIIDHCVTIRPPCCTVSKAV